MNPTEQVWCRNRNAIVDELRERGLDGGVFVEIGVKQGVFSKVLLENTNCRKLILIDPWEDQDVKEQDEIQHNHQSDYDITMNKLRDFIDAGRVEILRGLSTDVAHRIPPGSVDFIYIDGNHSQNGVRDDLNMQWGKLRPGGLMMGDDYHKDPEETVTFPNFTATFGVTKAVKEFSIQRGLSVNLNQLADWHYSYSNQNQERIIISARNWIICKPIV